MRRKRLLALVLPASFFLGSLGLGSSSLTACSSGGAGADADCFDYGSFDGTSPSASFKADVLPIFRTSCGISSACHGCDATDNPGCTNAGYMPYLGPAMSDPAPTPAQIQAIFDQAVGQPASLQTSTVDPSAMVGDPGLSIVKAGDPANSFMMYKLDGDPTATDMTAEVTCSTLKCAADSSCGLAMPSGGPQLPQDSRDTIRRWIAQGAKND